MSSGEDDAEGAAVGRGARRGGGAAVVIAPAGLAVGVALAVALGSGSSGTIDSVPVGAALVAADPVALCAGALFRAVEVEGGA